MPIMKFFIQHADGRELGTLEDSGGDMVCIGECAVEIAEAMKEAHEKGVPFYRWEELQGDAARALLMETIFPGNEAFPLAFKEHLARTGFVVREDNAETVEEVAKLLSEFPECEEKTELLASLPGMSRLQLTYILKTLKEAVDNQHAPVAY
jgi:hypothetical protein